MPTSQPGPVNPLIPLIIPAGVVALTLLGLFIAWLIRRRIERRRQAALAPVAAELGLSYMAMDPDLLPQFAGLPFFPGGGAAKATSVMRGTIENVPTTFFDYQATIGSGKNRNTVRQTAAAFDLGAGSLPVFHVQYWKSNFLTRLLDLFSGPRVEFPDDPEFGAFRVSSADTDRVRALFDAELRAFVKQRPSWIIEADGRWLRACQLKKRPEPEAYRQFVTEAVDVLLVFKDRTAR